MGDESNRLGGRSFLGARLRHRLQRAGAGDDMPGGRRSLRRSMFGCEAVVAPVSGGRALLRLPVWPRPPRCRRTSSLHQQVRRQRRRHALLVAGPLAGGVVRPHAAEHRCLHPRLPCHMPSCMEQGLSLHDLRRRPPELRGRRREGRTAQQAGAAADSLPVGGGGAFAPESDPRRGTACHTMLLVVGHRGEVEPPAASLGQCSRAVAGEGHRGESASNAVRRPCAAA
mmetsp:Transcript_125649/g.363553  ORF Transcript_125649/g.363553 Transcript_125649/m.363553 type:complete len:227 (+) Transcript_125649:1897-2577(+)